MKPSFYLRFRRSVPFGQVSLGLLALWGAGAVTSCGNEANEGISSVGKAGSEVITSAFLAKSTAGPYHPVPREELIPRYIDKLRHGSRTGLRFAKEALGAYGDKAVPALLEGLKVELEEGNTSAANFLATLSYTKTEQPLPLLLEVLSRHPLPLVRSQALDTIGHLDQVSLLPGVLEHAAIEAESGPMTRMLPCVAELGGREGAAYLASQVEEWLLAGGGRGNGPMAWDNLLLVEGDFALDHIVQLIDRMPAILKISGVIRLLEAGRTEWQDEVRGLLDYKSTPSGGIRRKAVSALAGIGDWEGVRMAMSDPDLQVRFAVIDALRLPNAEVTDEALAFLHKSASSPSEDASYPAVRALLERGELNSLDPWLLQVKGYPTRPGSVNAVKLFLQPGIAHPRLVSLLISRWEYCESDYRIDITRVLAKHPSPEAIAFLEKIVLDPDEDAEVRLYTISSLGNSGSICIPSLFRIWEQKPSPAAIDRLFGAMLRYPDDKRVRDFSFDLVVNPDTPDGALAMMLNSMPPAFREDAYPGLLAALKVAEREEVRVFIEGLLHDYF